MEEITKYSSDKQLTKEDIKTLEAVGIIPKDTPPAQVELFARVCFEKNLSPFSKQIHLIARNDNKTNTKRYTHQTAIDGFRAIADRTGKYAGNDNYLFDDGLTEYQMIVANKKIPTTATATIYKIVGGVRCSFSATARWEEYYPGDTLGFMWKKMPFLMLGKCAESLALRKAFPENLGGIYTNEEMMQAETVEAPDSKAKKVAPKKVEEPEEVVAQTEVDPILEQIKTRMTVAGLNDIYMTIPDDKKGNYLEKLSNRKAILKANKKEKAVA